MTRDEAIKILDNEKPCCGEKIAYTEGERSAAYDMAIAALREQGNCCKKGNSSWVSVEDRLPDDMGDVLVVVVWHERWQTMIGWCRKAEEEWMVYTSHGERKPGDVTHWMPLPEPPEVG